MRKGIQMIDWSVTPFLKIVQLYYDGQFTWPYVSGISNISSLANSLSEKLAAFPHIIYYYPVVGRRMTLVTVFF